MYIYILYFQLKVQNSKVIYLYLSNYHEEKNEKKKTKTKSTKRKVITM